MLGWCLTSRLRRAPGGALTSVSDFMNKIVFCLNFFFPSLVPRLLLIGISILAKFALIEPALLKLLEIGLIYDFWLIQT